jgi:hypothetical protein
MRRALAAVLLGLALSGPAAARDPVPLSPELLFEGLVRESDVDLVFDYLRESARAAFRGREAPPPPDALTQRAGEMAGEFRRRGDAAVRIFIDAIEKNVREGIREQQPRPQRPSHRTNNWI